MASLPADNPLENLHENSAPMTEVRKSAVLSAVKIAAALQATALALLLQGVSAAGVLDMLTFGDAASERAHQANFERAGAAETGALGEPVRRLLPKGEGSWEGGRASFEMRVDPDRPNAFTIRLWGEDVTHNRLTLHIEGKQIGYRHLGDLETLDFGCDRAACPGRFYYRTCPLPLELTRGKEKVTCEIRANGPIWDYGSSFEQYQKPMTEPSRNLYRVYTHPDGDFEPPADEKQGHAAPDPPLRRGPGPEVMEAVKARVNGELSRLLAEPARPCNQMQTLFLAKAYRTGWTVAAARPEALVKILTSLDALYRGYVADPQLARAEPSTYNPEWFGLGPAGQVLALVGDRLAPQLDEEIDDGRGGRVRRREGFGAMLIACRDWHRENRRQYTNQSMINDLYGIYLANRGIAVIAPGRELPEPVALRYLYESVGLEPWLGSEKDGKPLRPLGDDYFQLTARGLTKELGFVGNYGEVLDWVSEIEEATRPAPDQPGDARIKAQLAKIARARTPFRYPLPDGEGCRAMAIETAVGWRDTHFPGDVAYDQRPSWDGSPLQAAAATLDPVLVGAAQQMFADHQFFASLAGHMEEEKGFRVTAGLLGVPERYERIQAQPPSPRRLPMSPGQPDFVFSDEEDGVVAVKHGGEIFYTSLYWRARHAVNFLARVHRITPRFDEIAVVRQRTEFTPSGMTFTRPDWTDFGFANGGHRYPDAPVSAHAGEILPIARIPAGVAFKPGQENIHAGRGDYYELRYGPYFIAMNMSADRTFDLTVPAGRSGAGVKELPAGGAVEAGAIRKVPPRTTVVLWLE